MSTRPCPTLLRAFRLFGADEMPLTDPAALAWTPNDPIELLRDDSPVPVYSALAHPIQGSGEARIALRLVYVRAATVQVVPKHLEDLVCDLDAVPRLHVKEGHCRVRIAVGLVRFGSGRG